VNIDNNELEYKPITYIMKHKVKKKMFRIAFQNKEVFVTEDHSIMIKREDKIISVSPNEIQKGDKIIFLQEESKMYYIETEDFLIDCVGEIEDWVYDIEVEKNHNFFANDILVHNSFYLTLSALSPFLYKKFNVTEFEDFQGRADALNDFAENVIQKMINEECRSVSEYLHTNPKLFMKREAIALRALWLSSKKRYLLSVIDMEGVRYEHPKLKVTGVEIVKSSIPQTIRDGLFSLMETILLTKDPYSIESQNKFNNIISEMKGRFKKLSPKELAFPRSVTEIKKWQDSAGNPIKGTPVHVYGAIRFNQFVEKHPETNLELIKEGEKLRFFYLKSPNKFNTHVISFKTDLPKDFYEFLDYKKMIEKTFFDIISLILTEVNLNLEYNQKSANVMQMFKKKN